MPIRRQSLFSQELALVLHNVGVRTGVFTGVALALGFTIWLYAANRIPSLESVALERNFIAAVALALIASIPVLRFLRAPGNLLVASLIAWSILSLTYRGLTVHFTHLAERYSAVQIFALGAIVFMILATLSWIGTCLWRLRGPHLPHPNHESHISHSNHHI
jgi:low temperature requirement protein LtrA